ncbi:MAG: beta-N-acetylhexosaminidase [Agarilytica sp.]
MSDNTLGPVMLDIAGHELQVEEKEVLRHPQVGGLILFTRNYEDPHQLRELIASIRDVRAELVISVDHEGGRVQRFRTGFTHLPPMQSLAQEYARDTKTALNDALELGWLMAAELIAFDIDISFAPILDLDDNKSMIIGDRAFNSDPEIATALAEKFIDGMSEAGMAATGKHFPGHGGVVEDSHLELPIDNRSLETLKAHDLIPFQRLKSKLAALMSAHIAFPQVDPELVSFSSFWLRDFLRDEMGYQGIVFSDDLSMEGAAGVGNYAERARLTLAAGCDVALVCNNPKGAIEIIEALERARVADSQRSMATMRRTQRYDENTVKSSKRWKTAQAIVEKLKSKA